NPAAWIGLLAVAGPVAIHILVQRKAERLPFPSLRFLQQTRLASIRRRVLEDRVLLAIRAAIVIAAVTALAGPLIITPARRQEWNARVVRAVVVEVAARTSSAPADVARAPADAPKALLSQSFEATSIRDGIVRALAWFADAPPARRELVIVG